MQFAKEVSSGEFLFLNCDVDNDCRLGLAHASRAPDSIQSLDNGVIYFLFLFLDEFKKMEMYYIAIWRVGIKIQFEEIIKFAIPNAIRGIGIKMRLPNRNPAC